jgi:hypothetical protein
MSVPVNVFNEKFKCLNEFYKNVLHFPLSLSDLTKLGNS